MQSDEELVRQIDLLLRKRTPPPDRVLQQVISILREGRSGKSRSDRRSSSFERSFSSGASTHRHNLERLSFSSRDGLSECSVSTSSTASEVNWRSRQKHALQPAVTKPEHLSLEIGDTVDWRRAAYAEQYVREPAAYGDARAKAKRDLQNMMEGKKHADLLPRPTSKPAGWKGEDEDWGAPTQIGSAVTYSKSMTERLEKGDYGALTEIAAKLNKGREAWVDKSATKGPGWWRPDVGIVNAKNRAPDKPYQHANPWGRAPK
mmetsp:Transcript_62520/g.104052  ORF Transcript_62520/g.104052 Transcript_62520/m.104052 type:complete len:261 (-) Transcript_62520:290-1072(-)|eukprot:CAMPEP_0119331070 /NCGR_PEP_ID=MMETSP1333-20130426/79706_1 /TAXON_ID=418940 /ORGANISM="Scyphosphaera apsteinii, Strain RCC1455" /LENGTH=260 /DNA_ID=CAMNT_0007340589 /DNA_START=108 /DNA_END=893 /DNA_ORIENTATION=+